MNEFAKIAGGMLFMQGHVMSPETARLLAQVDRPPERKPRSGKRAPRRPDGEVRIYATLVALAAIWGGSFLFQRVAAKDFGPLPMVEVRLALGALVLLPFLIRERARFTRSRWLAVIVIGALNTTLPFLLFAWGAERAPAGVSAISNSMAVPFAALAAFFVFGERIGVRRAAALLAGLVGVAVLASGHVAGSNIGAAVAAGTLAALMYGISANLLKRYLSDLPPAALAAAALLCGTIELAPLAFATWPATPIPAHSWMSVIALGVLCTGTAYALYFNLIQRVGAPRAAMVTWLVPAFGVAWGWLFLGEPLTLSMAVGGALILGGMIFGQRDAKRRVPALPVIRHGHPSPTCVECG
ncbi:MAG TPA: DMT family transporter [Rhodanobacteraceae bacterium]|nr:DMT family transporter [Rhodanobacteraceae bacterium]